MNGKHLHCKSDGTACVSEDAGTAVDDVVVLPYEEGMQVIVRAELANGVRRCTTASVEGMADGEMKAIVDLEAAGEGAKVVSCVVKGGLTGGGGSRGTDDGRARLPNVPDSGNGRAGAPRTSNDDDGGTPAELWVSGIKDVPSALPNGNIPFLTMQKYWYEEIKCGAKDVEHRKQCPKYRKWFVDHHPVAVKLQCGYTNKQMIWEIKDVEDCGEDGIDIFLGKRIQ